MSNVINLFSRSTKTGSEGQADGSPEANSGVHQLNPVAQKKSEKVDFQAIAERNEAVRARLQKERADANKSVLRSYRIK